MEFIEKLLKFTNPQDLGYAGIFEYLIQFHITFGLISLITGTLILALRKGDANHKKVGRVFVIVMLGNFLLGVPLGSLGQLLVGEPASFMTVVGALFVGTATFSGYRLAKAGVGAHMWYDKGMLGLQIFTSLGYFYLAVLMVAGGSVLGLTALTESTAEQFVFADNSFLMFELGVALVSTTGGTVFAIIAAENFATPLFLSLVVGWFSYQDWMRIFGKSPIERQEIIQQHLARLLVMYGAAVGAVLLNTSWLSLAVCWTFPTAIALAASFYYRRVGYRRRTRTRTRTSTSTGARVSRPSHASL